MKKWLPTLTTIASIAIAATAPQAQALIKQHPAATTLLTGIWAILNHLLESPINGNKKQPTTQGH